MQIHIGLQFFRHGSSFVALSSPELGRNFEYFHKRCLRPPLASSPENWRNTFGNISPDIFVTFDQEAKIENSPTISCMKTVSNYQNTQFPAHHKKSGLRHLGNGKSYRGSAGVKNDRNKILKKSGKKCWQQISKNSERKQILDNILKNKIPPKKF